MGRNCIPAFVVPTNEPIHFRPWNSFRCYSLHTYLLSMTEYFKKKFVGIRMYYFDGHSYIYCVYTRVLTHFQS